MVKLAKEYIIHDAYNLRMIKALKTQLKQVFGKRFNGVRKYFIKN